MDFSDGIKFEIIPAFLNEGGKSYTYADSNNRGSWQVCKPALEIEAINELNFHRQLWRDQIFILESCPIAIRLKRTSYPKTIKTSKMHKIFVIGVL
ncbi:hypothetical protein [Bacillus cereus group sp. MG9]|uniref:SMODS domain-containing nucleotidyltransferase n=1 Tax=Bacillus cereus group sp. MG9 TaxID=3040247 RepID=UPI003397857A